jgi:hypothetical protein
VAAAAGRDRSRIRARIRRRSRGATLGALDVVARTTPQSDRVPGSSP